MCQLAYRVRTNQGSIKLNIYGNFGDEEIEDAEIKYKNISNVISVMDSYYNNYSNINYLQYIGLLEYYGLYIDEELNEEKYKTKKTSKTSDYEITMNLKESFNKYYRDIYNHCSSRNKEDWLQILKPTKLIKTNKKIDNARLEAIKTKFIKAIDYNIHFKLILTNNRFETKRLSDLANASNNYQRSDVFKQIADEVISNFYYGGDKVVIENFKNRYDELNSLQQESFKTLTNLLFNVERFDRKRLVINAKNTSYNDKCIKIYLNSFYKEYSMVC